MTTEEKVERIKLIKELDKEQEEINKQYEKEGLTDEVLDRQIAINEKRHKENITDPKELIYKNFAQ